MYVEYYSNRTGKLLGTIMEHKGRLFTDSTEPFLLDELQHFGKPGKSLLEYFGKVSRRSEMETMYKVYNDNEEEIVITEDGKILVLKDVVGLKEISESYAPRDVSSVDDVVYARIAYYNLDNKRLGAIEYRDGNLIGLDTFGTKFLAERMQGVKPGFEEFNKKYVLMVNLQERASYVSNLVEEVVREGDITDA